MFVISLTYIRPLDDVDSYLAEHVEYLTKHYGSGHFLASGRKVPRTGGIILAQASSREEIEAVIALDPFYRHGLAQYDITEFTPTMTSEAFGFLGEHLTIS